MKIQIAPIEKLLDMAIKKSQCTSDRFGYNRLTTLINESRDENYKEISNRYINETIIGAINKAKRETLDYIQVNPASLDTIAAYIGFTSFEDFRLKSNPALSAGQLALTGNWYSIVRSNSGEPFLLFSPVSIEILDNNTALMKMMGPSRNYSGPINWVAGSISCYLSSEDKAKHYHLTFKVGVVKNPQLLKGVFSGISTDGSPVAGKEILVKSNSLLSEMSNHKINLQDPEKNAPFDIDHRILRYFEDFDKCYIKIKQASTFDMEDLGSSTTLQLKR